MKKMKKLLALVLTFLLVLGSTGINVYAESKNDLSEGITANIDLTKEGTQTVNTVDKDGNEVVITATKIEKITPMDTDLDYGWSSWKISYNTAFSYVQYYIDIYISASTGLAEIRDVYDPEYYILTYTVNDWGLEIVRANETSTRSARAELWLDLTIAVVGGGSFNGWLRTDVQDMYLTIDANL